MIGEGYTENTFVVETLGGTVVDIFTAVGEFFRDLTS